MRHHRHLIAAAAIGVSALYPTGSGHAHDYPTEVLADYVFACMASNGQTRTALENCACSIDVIASIVPIDDYIEAETYLSMGQVRGGGEKMALFRETPMAKAAVDKVKRAQVEAELRCF